MASIDLVFGDLGAYTPPPGGAVDLVLGDTYGVSGAPTDASLALVLRVRPAFTVDRPSLLRAGAVGQPWGVASRAPERNVGLPWTEHDGARATGSAALPWAAFGGGRALGSTAVTWGGTSAHVDGAPRLPWGVAAPAGRDVALAWGLAAPSQRSGRLPWDAAGHALRSVALPWKATARALRPIRLPWDAASQLPGVNRPLPADPGAYGIRPTVQRVDLDFCHLAPASLDLVFNEPCLPLARIPDGYVIASRSAYVTTHSITAYKLPGTSTPLPIDGFTLTADADSYAWSLSASGPEALRTLLETSGGVPASIELIVDGMSWVFIVESVRRDRSFGSTTVSISGRSATALLGDPYMPPSAWLNAVPMTAAQLIEEALSGTGVDLDWQCDDWTIPAGAWSFTGTPLQVALQVAQSIGAVVSSHRTLPRLIVAPRYADLPWTWDGLSPDVTLGFDAVVTEGYERADRPAYDGVYVSGQAQGVLALIKRTGSGPSTVMPLVTDPLITHLDAARQRGESLLGAAGPQARMRELIPVLTGTGEPGVIDPGKIVAVPDPGGDWVGLTRGVTLSYQRPVLDQTIVLERHL